MVELLWEKYEGLVVLLGVLSCWPEGCDYSFSGCLINVVVAVVLEKVGFFWYLHNLLIYLTNPHFTFPHNSDIQHQPPYNTQCLTPYLPTSEPQLEDVTYQRILEYFLYNDEVEVLLITKCLLIKTPC